MGGLFGGGGSRSEPRAAKPAVPDPRPMPDPESPAVRRAEVQKRGEISRRAGRVSTDLTMRQRRRNDAAPLSALGSI